MHYERQQTKMRQTNGPASRPILHHDCDLRTGFCEKQSLLWQDCSQVARQDAAINNTLQRRSWKVFPCGNILLLRKTLRG